MQKQASVSSKALDLQTSSSGRSPGSGLLSRRQAPELSQGGLGFRV